MPEVSVIIPVYNAERYLNETLTSVTGQTFRDIEFIFVNDCSTDNSPAILEEFARKDSRIRIINNEKNSGAAVSRNKGLEAATGKYLLFLDADDLFEPTLAEEVVNRMESSGADIVIYNYDKTCSPKTINLKKCKNVYSKEYFSPEEIPDRIFNLGPLNAFSKCFRKSLIETEGIKFQDLKSCNDVYFTMSALATAKRISILDKVLVHYREEAQNNISSKRGNYYQNIVSAMCEVKNLLVQKNKYNLFRHSFVRAFRDAMRYEYKKMPDENKQLFTEYCKKTLGADWRLFKIVTYPVLLQKILRIFE